MKKYLANILLSLILLIPFLPQFGEIDRVTSQWVFLNIFSLLSLIYLSIENVRFDSKGLIRNQIHLYSIFILFGFLSFFKSLNIIESLVEIFRFLSILSALIISITLFNRIDNKKGFLFGIIFLSLFLEVTGVFFQVINNIYPSGFTGNKNIQSVSLIFKSAFLLPFLLSNKIIYNAISSLTLLFVFFAIYSIGAKAGLVEIVFFCVLFPIIFFFKKSDKNKFVLTVKSFLPLLIFAISSLVYSINNSSLVNNINGTLNYTSEPGSVNRLRYYSRALQSISDNPLLGVGLGNWKIVATKLDSESMKNYIVQYYTHNDFLQYTAEVGLIGGLFFILFYAFLLVGFLKNLLKTKRSKLFINYLILFLTLSIFIIDSNLNFPSTRVFMQINFLLILLFNEYSFSLKDEK